MASSHESGDPQIQITPPGSSGVVFVNDDGTGTVVVSKGDADVKNGKLTINCEFDSGEKKEFSFPIDFAGATAVNQTFKIPTDKVGYWKIEATFNSSSTVLSGAAVVAKPSDYNVSDPNSFFGSMLVRDFEAADRIGCKIDRQFAIWGAIERQQGTYTWSNLDEVINKATEHNIGVLLAVVPSLAQGGKITWATWQHDADLVSEPQFTYYKNFLTALVTRYKGKLAGIELFNEPDLQYYKNAHEDVGRAAEFTAKLQAESYKIIKSIDPDVPIVGLSISGVDFRNGMEFFKTAIRSSKGSMDIFGGHGYAPEHFIDNSHPVVYPEQYNLTDEISNALGAMRQQGMTPRFWGTEIGYAYPGGLDPLSDDARSIAAATAQTLIDVKSVPGAEKLFWFVYTFNKKGGDKPGFTHSMFYENGNPPFPYPMVSAYAACSRLLYNTKPAGNVSVRGNITALRFNTLDGKNSIVAVWSNSGKHKLKVQVSDNSTLHVFNTFGREETIPDLTVTITNNPTYYVFPAGVEPKFEN